MCKYDDKDEDGELDRLEVNKTTSDQIVTPIYNGHTQPECTFEEYVENLPDDQPINWSSIK